MKQALQELFKRSEPIEGYRVDVLLDPELPYEKPDELTPEEEKELDKIWDAEAKLQLGFDPNQPRDKYGKWTDTGDTAVVEKDITGGLEKITKDKARDIAPTAGWIKDDSDIYTNGKYVVEVRDEKKMGFTERGIKQYGIKTIKGAAELVGAQPGALIIVTNDEYGMRVKTIHEDYVNTRMFSQEQGVIANDTQDVFQKGQGLGTKILLAQAEAAQKYGYKKLVTHAVGSGAMHAKDEDSPNGYYTWPRLGYDAPLPKFWFRADSSAHPIEKAVGEYATKRGFTKISDFMKTQEDRDWWKLHGTPMDLEFDLSENSDSLRRLRAYAAATQPKKVLDLSNFFLELGW